MVFNRRPRNEKQERLFKQWKQDVLSVLVASKTGIDTRKLQGKCFAWIRTGLNL